MSAAQAAIRFGYGPGPNDLPADDPRAALKAQLRGPDPGLASGKFSTLPSGAQAVACMRADFKTRRQILAKGLPLKGNFKPQSAAMFRQDVAAQVAWAASTPYGFRERLVWFWANHFSFSASQNLSGPLIGPLLREAIRPHVTGKFTDMVLAVERHPAMLRYLANAASVGPDSPVGLRTHRGLNENLGRECMELHTVGLAAGYTQTDVTNMAKVLTGWSVSTGGGGDSTGFLFRPRAHEPGAQTVLGQSFGGGEQAGIDAFTYLSTYPTTYESLAHKLAVHFIADDPPPGAVVQLAGVLRETGGDLGATSAALVDLPQAWVPGTKFKTPFDYFISALRAAPPAAAPPAATLPAGEVLNSLNGLGQPLWNAPLPNGWPDSIADWSGADAVMTRIDWAYTYAGRRHGAAGGTPGQLAQAALGPLLRPATVQAITQAGGPRAGLTVFLSAPEFQWR